MSEAKKRSLEAKLDGRQRKAALLCVQREFTPEEERMGFDQIAEEVGVSRNTLYEWRTQKRPFIDYVNILADEHLEEKRALVYRQLMKLIEGSQPSVKAIDLYMRRHGLLTERQVIETKDSGAGRSNDDISAELAELESLLADTEAE